MPARQRAQHVAADRARSLRTEIGRSLREARIDRDLSLRAVAHLSGMSAAQASRIERGLVPTLSIDQVVHMAATVGLDLSARLYPGGNPVRDVAHSALLARLRTHLHPSLVMAMEVPLPLPRDTRAWDGVIRGRGWVLAVEAETRPRDVQALERRIALKMRDSGIEQVVLLLLRSRHNARLLREHGSIRERFPIEGRVLLGALQAGERPGGSGTLVL